MGVAAYKEGKFKDALDETFKIVDELIESSEGQAQLNRIRNGGEGSKVQGGSEYIGGAVGCTANVILITPTMYIVANAGDSRSVLCRGGKALALS